MTCTAGRSRKHTLILWMLNSRHTGELIRFEGVVPTNQLHVSRETWFNVDDVNALSAAGINMVRVPVSFVLRIRCRSNNRLVFSLGTGSSRT
jgi:hypothetical protein